MNKIFISRYLEVIALGEDNDDGEEEEEDDEEDEQEDQLTRDAKLLGM